MSTQTEAVREKVTIGLDVGDRHTHYCELDESAEKIAEGRFRTTIPALEGYLGGREASRVVLEVGTHSGWMSREVKRLGHEGIVANARQVALIHQSHRKTDRTDAETLARLGRVDVRLLSPITHRSEEAQADLAVLRSREALVRSRTQLINQVRGTVKAMGGRVPACSAPAFVRRVGEKGIAQLLRNALDPVLEAIATLTEKIREMDRRVEVLVRERYPEVERMRQVAGVGPITALCYRLTIDDPGRFRKSREVGAYLGLVPRRDDSGERSPQLGITKRGDGMLRRLLVCSAHYILGPFGPESGLRAWGLGLCERGGKDAKKRAAVAVARKLAVLLHRLWVSGEGYEPFYGIAREDAA